MKGAVLYGPREVRFEEREAPKIEKPADVIIRISATCVCGSDLWPYREIQQIAQPTPMGHEHCGIVEEVGKAVKSVKPGQFRHGFVFLPPTIPVPTAASDTRLRVRTGSSLAPPSRPCCGCRLRTARSSLLRRFRRRRRSRAC